MDIGKREKKEMNISVTIIESGKTCITNVASGLVDVIYDMIEKTYHNVNEISIKNPTSAPCNELGEFLTYILAYPKDVRTPRVVVIDKELKNVYKKERRFANRIIVCYSGGVDSTGALLKLIDEGKHPVALWCDYGQPYRVPEKKAVEYICSKLDVPLIEATLDLSDLIALGENRFGHVFPARNLLIATICLCFEPMEIVLAGLCDELMVPDKSIRMYQEFGVYFGVSLYSPFIKMTKTDVLCLWKAKWDKYLDASETVSCYSDNGNCQNCSSCAKREVAMVASGYTNIYPKVFTNQHKLIEEHWFSRIDKFQYERRTDMLIALEKFHDRLDSKLQELLDLKYIQYRDEISKRKKELGIIGENDIAYE